MRPSVVKELKYISSRGIKRIVTETANLSISAEAVQAMNALVDELIFQFVFHVINSVSNVSHFSIAHISNSIYTILSSDIANPAVSQGEVLLDEEKERLKKKGLDITIESCWENVIFEDLKDPNNPYTPSIDSVREYLLPYHRIYEKLNFHSDHIIQAQAPSTTLEGQNNDSSSVSTNLTFRKNSFYRPESIIFLTGALENLLNHYFHVITQYTIISKKSAIKMEEVLNALSSDPVFGERFKKTEVKNHLERKVTKKYTRSPSESTDSSRKRSSSSSSHATQRELIPPYLKENLKGYSAVIIKEDQPEFTKAKLESSSASGTTKIFNDLQNMLVTYDANNKNIEHEAKKAASLERKVTSKKLDSLLTEIQNVTDSVKNSRNFAMDITSDMLLKNGRIGTNKNVHSVNSLELSLEENRFNHLVEELQYSKEFFNYSKSESDILFLNYEPQSTAEKNNNVLTLVDFLRLAPAQTGNDVINPKDTDLDKKFKKALLEFLKNGPTKPGKAFKTKRKLSNIPIGVTGIDLVTKAKSLFSKPDNSKLKAPQKLDELVKKIEEENQIQVEAKHQVAAQDSRPHKSDFDDPILPNEGLKKKEETLDDLDEEFLGKKKKNKEESLAEFLKNSEPTVPQTQVPPVLSYSSFGRTPNIQKDTEKRLSLKTSLAPTSSSSNVHEEKHESENANITPKYDRNASISSGMMEKITGSSVNISETKSKLTTSSHNSTSELTSRPPVNLAEGKVKNFISIMEERAKIESSSIKPTEKSTKENNVKSLLFRSKTVSVKNQEILSPKKESDDSEPKKRTLFRRKSKTNKSQELKEEREREGSQASALTSEAKEPTFTPPVPNKAKKPSFLSLSFLKKNPTVSGTKKGSNLKSSDSGPIEEDVRDSKESLEVRPQVVSNEDTNRQRKPSLPGPPTSPPPGITRSTSAYTNNHSLSESKNGDPTGSSISLNKKDELPPIPISVNKTEDKQEKTSILKQTSFELPKSSATKEESEKDPKWDTIVSQDLLSKQISVSKDKNPSTEFNLPEDIMQQNAALKEMLQKMRENNSQLVQQLKSQNLNGSSSSLNKIGTSQTAVTVTGNTQQQIQSLSSQLAILKHQYQTVQSQLLESKNKYTVLNSLLKQTTLDYEELKKRYDIVKETSELKIQTLTDENSILKAELEVFKNQLEKVLPGVEVNLSNGQVEPVEFNLVIDKNSNLEVLSWGSGK